ncbi:SAM-dependent methyltransferase [Microlunatus sp. GCM10028923]|uniref:SAM-dependent methyltransferase n=1 Tax=Microlunatus sp. GCM10028923 TaxID=3273400 RepID=UPI00360DC317
MNTEHPSAGWTTFLNPPEPAEPSDRGEFDRLMRPDRYPRSSTYDTVWVSLNLMGPNSLWLMEDLAEGLDLHEGDRVLDLGCGSAITSIFLAREYGVRVTAADLWIDPTENQARIDEAGVGHLVTPLRVEAHALPFAHESFDTIVSVDAYHYFGTDVRYLSQLKKLVRADGRIGIVVPGNSIDPDDRPDDVQGPWPDRHGADWFTFRSAQWWERHWRRTPGISIRSSSMIKDGWELWHRHHLATAAWTGQPPAEVGDEPMLHHEAGRTLGFVRLIASVS